MAVDPLDPTLLRKQNRQQLFSDILRNARGAPEAALTMGTSLADMAGTGLGTLAGMAKQKLSGEDVNLDAASEGLQEGRFTYRPRTEGGQETLRGLETVTAPLEKGAQWAGQKTSDVTGSPALGAAVYTGLNVLDPEMLAPAAAKVAALRGASRVARSATFEPVSSAGMGGKQRGAWSPGDIADVEGDFSMRSTVEDALSKLKPQETKAKGKQMLAVLKKYGAKEEELKWSGLNDILASDVPVTADEIRAHMGEFGVQIEQSRRGESAPPDADTGAPTLDEDEINEKAYEYARDDSDLEYPYVVTRDGEPVGTYDTYREAQRALEQEQKDLIESETEYYLENIEEHLDEERLAEMSDSEKQDWAEQMAADAADNYTWDASPDYEADPHNLEELQQYYAERIRNNPESYGLEGGTKGAKWDSYVIESPTGKKGENYGETITQLKREGRFGRGVERDTAMVPDNYDTMTPFQKAQYEALRKTRQDPAAQRAAKDYTYTTHFDEVNPLVYTRESTWPKPVGSATEGTTRMIEELQSDWGQLGRKKGIYDPDKAKAEAEKAMAAMPQKYAELGGKLQGLFSQLEPGQMTDVARRSGFQTTEEFLADLGPRLEAEQRSPTPDFPQFIAALADNVYYATANMNVERAARDLNSEAIDTGATIQGKGNGKALPPAPFIGDAKKFSQLALQQAIADAVRRGDQYVGVSPGYTHAPERWGSEDLSWWTEQQGPVPNEAQAELFGEGGGPQPSTKRKVAARSGSTETTRGEKWKEMVNALRRGTDSNTSYYAPNVSEIDVNSPDALNEVENIVRDKLSYEAGQYADPDKFIRDRAAKILASMQKQQEGQYSPRSHGMNEFYDNIVPSVLEKVLKEAGSTGSGKGVVRGAEAPIGRPMAMVFDETLNEWRPRELNSQSEIDQYRELAATQPNKYQFRPAQMHYVEIDPELARAAKRGFKLPF